MDRTRTTGGTKERGFSLVEVIIAIGVLAGVLVSISSMFILGGRQVKTGKTITEATTICHDIMETFDQKSFVGLYKDFGAADTDSSVSVSSTTALSKLNPWQAEITRKLDGGSATALIEAVGTGSPTQFKDAVAVKLTITTNWTELGRPQTVTITTLRF